MASLRRNDNKAYELRLRAFLDEFISHVLKTKEKRDMLFSEENMKIWVQAFTHNTYSIEDNYEALEYIGDRTLKALFPIYLDQMYDNLSNSVFTNLESVYMNGEHQGYLGQQIGFGPYIRVGMDQATLALEADVFESFFGALVKTSNNISFGLGFIVCYNMFSYIFEQYITIDFNKKGPAPKTEVEQIFNRFHVNAKPLKAVNFVFDQKAQKGEIYINYDGINFLQKMGIIKRKDYGGKIVMAKVSGGAEKVVEKEAFSKALDFLDKLGVNSDWAAEAKRKADWEKIREKNPQLFEDFLQRCEIDGVKEPFFHTDSKADSDKGNLIQLRAYDENDKAVLLSSAVKKPSDPTNPFDFRINLIKKYVYQK